MWADVAWKHLHDRCSQLAGSVQPAYAGRASLRRSGLVLSLLVSPAAPNRWLKRRALDRALKLLPTWVYSQDIMCQVKSQINDYFRRETWGGRSPCGSQSSVSGFSRPLGLI